MIKDKYKDFERLVDEGSLTSYEYIMVELMRDIRDNLANQDMGGQDSLAKPGTLETEQMIPLKSKKSKKK